MTHRATTLTHCPYCALNCGIGLETAAGRLTGQVRWKGSPLTAGAVCSKGATAWEQVHHDDRLLLPLVRRNGDLVETTWEDALDAAADGFLRIRERHGADANAVLSGGSLTNEKAYLMGKFARLALRTRHIDYNGRFCMVAAGTANLKAFGLDRAMTPLSELVRADVIVVVGANLSDAYPVTVPQTIHKARQRGARVVVIDPRFGRWVQDDDLRIAIRPSTDGALFCGLLAEVERQGLLDCEFIGRRTAGFEEAIAAVRRWQPEAVEAATGVSAATVRELAALIGGAEQCMILHARGPEQQTMGTDNVLAMINLALACGHIGKPGCGINMLTGQRNGQGGREWGQRCNQLPGGRSIVDPAHREVVAERWGVGPDELPAAGLTYVEILQSAGRGDIKGLLSISNNMSVSAPDLARVEQQLAALDHLVVIDPFLSESARHATVVLPGSTFAEEEGTITTIEGMVVRCDQAVAPVSGRSDIDVLRELARRCGVLHQFDFRRGREVFAEMRRVSAGAPNDYAGITWERAREGVFWPCPDVDHPGTPQLYTERFAHRDGRARFHAVECATPPVIVDEDRYPFVLTTGRHLAQYLSGNQTKRIAAQQAKAPGPYVELNPATATSLGLSEDDRVVLTSRQGRSVVPWVPNTRIRPDTVFMPYHWRECNVLTSADLDPISKIPGFKYTPIDVRKLAAPGAGTVRLREAAALAGQPA